MCFSFSVARNWRTTFRGSSRQAHFSASLSQNRAWTSRLTRLL